MLQRWCRQHCDFADADVDTLPLHNLPCYLLLYHLQCNLLAIQRCHFLPCLVCLLPQLRLQQASVNGREIERQRDVTEPTLHVQSRMVDITDCTWLRLVRLTSSMSSVRRRLSSVAACSRSASSRAYIDTQDVQVRASTCLLAATCRDLI